MGVLRIPIPGISIFFGFSAIFLLIKDNYNNEEIKKKITNYYVERVIQQNYKS